MDQCKGGGACAIDCCNDPIAITIQLRSFLAAIIIAIDLGGDMVAELM
jgi:hypothetical protein